jgi:MFS family permease
MAVFGVHAIVWGTVSTTARQLATPDALLGRVNSVYLLAAVGGAALGSLLGGVLAQQFGLTAPFVVAFVAMVAMTAVAWRPLRHVSVRASADTPQA